MATSNTPHPNLDGQGGATLPVGDPQEDHPAPLGVTALREAATYISHGGADCTFTENGSVELTSAAPHRTHLRASLTPEGDALHIEAWLLPLSPDDNIEGWRSEDHHDTADTLALAVMRATQPPTITKVVPLTAGISIPPSAERLTGKGSLVGVLYDALQNMRRTYLIQPLLDRIPGLNIASYGGAYPFQASGTWNGLHFYFRYRHGEASLRLAHDEEDLFTDCLLQAFAHPTAGGDGSTDIPVQGDGELTYPEFIELFPRLARDLYRPPAWEDLFQPEQPPRQGGQPV